MELFDERVVLFQSDEGGEHLLVTCEPSGMGGLVVRQTSEGPLTQWCFEESPHVVETFVVNCLPFLGHEKWEAFWSGYDELDT